jgi:hypothetical protein
VPVVRHIFVESHTLLAFLEEFFPQNAACDNAANYPDAKYRFLGHLLLKFLSRPCSELLIKAIFSTKGRTDATCTALKM